MRRSNSSRRTAGKSSKSGRGSYRGADGRKHYEEEMKRQQRKRDEALARSNEPFRFRLKVGEAREVVILDEEPWYFRYEHNLQDEKGHWSIFTGCVKEFDNCPVCQHQERESYYVMFLTVLDLTPYETNSGDRVEFSRKLLPVKTGMQKKFIRKWEKIGNLRGQVIELIRDGQKDPAIGSDVEWAEEMDEEELETYTRSWKDREGKKHTEKCYEPFDYEKIYGEPDIDKLMKIVGGEPSPGSTKANRRALRDEEMDDENDDVPWDEDEEDEEEQDEKPARRSRRSKKKEEDEEEERPTRRGRRSRNTSEDEDEEEEKPTRRSRRSRRDEEDDEEEEKPKRRSSRRRAKDEDEDEEEEKPRRRSRRSQEDEDEDEDEDEKPRHSAGKRTRVSRRKRG